MRQLVWLRFAVLLGAGVLLGYAASAAPTADQAFAAARQLYQTGHDQKAMEELQKFITSFNTDRRVHEVNYMLGRCYQRQQQYENALTAYTRVVTNATTADFAPLRAETHFQMADCYMTTKQYERALQSYRNCLKLSGADLELTATAQYWLAECLYQLGRVDEALPEYRKVAEIAPAHVYASWGIYSVGMIALRKGQYPEAIAALERVVTQYKDAEVVGEATLALGHAYVGRARSGKDDAARAADYRKAADTFTAVIAGEKTTPTVAQQARFALAQVYTETHDYAQAEALYAKSLDGLAPNSQQAMDVRLQRGHALYNLGRYREAIDEYKQVADNTRFPQSSADALYWLGMSWYTQGDTQHEARSYNEAISAFRRLLLPPGDKLPLAPRAALFVAYSYEGQADAGVADARAKALTAYRDVLAKWPGAGEVAQAQAGITRLTMQMTPKELSDLIGVLPSGAATWGAELRLARESFQAGKYDDVVTTTKKILDGKPTGDLLAQTAYLAGVALQKLGRSEEAMGFHQQVLATEAQGDLRIYAQRAYVQAALDSRKFTEARDAAQALVKLPTVAQEPADVAKERAERLMYLAEAFLGCGQASDAQAIYQQVVNTYPTSPLAPNALMGMAWAAEARKDRATAVAQYRDFLVKYPDHDLVAFAFFQLGNNLLEMNKLDEAIIAFQNVPKTHQLSDQATYRIAWAFRTLNKQEEANDQFTKLAEATKNDALAADSLFRVGEYWMEQKNYPKAMEAFQKALARAGQSNIATLLAYKLAVCAFYAEQYKVAADAFGKVVGVPDSEYAAESLFWRGRALEKIGTEQFGAAREAYTQYLVKYPRAAFVLDAALGAGRVALNARQFTTARDDLQKTLQLCAALKGASEALKEREKSVSPEAQFLLAQSYFDEKKYDQALTQYATVSAYPYEPWFSRSLLQMVRCSAILGDRQAAQATLQRLLTDKDLKNSDAAKQAPEVAKEYGLEVK